MEKIFIKLTMVLVYRYVSTRLQNKKKEELELTLREPKKNLVKLIFF